MIQGLYEAHLPVSNLEVSIEFYSKLGLELAWKDEDSAFFWVEKEKSWMGLWKGEEYKTTYHPSLRHIAFRVSYENLKRSLNWLRSTNVEPVPFGTRETIEPFVRPYQGNASVYFNDPDGNSLELMCFVDVPIKLRSIKKLSIEEWERLSKEAHEGVL
jgi:Lactoylglutathione lyase and related lyases